MLRHVRTDQSRQEATRAARNTWPRRPNMRRPNAGLAARRASPVGQWFTAKTLDRYCTCSRELGPEAAGAVARSALVPSRWIPGAGQHSMRLSRQRTGSCLLLLAALLAVPAVARPVPQLAEPDYTLYHTMCAGSSLGSWLAAAAAAAAATFPRLPPKSTGCNGGWKGCSIHHMCCPHAGIRYSRRCGRSWRAALQP